LGRLFPLNRISLKVKGEMVGTLLDLPLVVRVIKL
jgi:hypothetical protein